MRAICVDDEPLVLDLVVALCRELPQLSEVQGFGSAEEALSYVERQKVDLALLDIDMPDMNGIELAMRIKQRQPDTAILFLTGYAQYRSLSRAELRAFPDWVAIRHFQLQATILEIYGIGCIDEGFIDAQLSWLHQWLAAAENFTAAF